MSPLRSAASVPVLLLAALAAHASPEPEPATPRLNSAILADDVLARVRYLSSDEMQGRESGTVGGTAAEAYVAAELARAGLEPAGEGGTPFQTVKLPARPIVASECRLEMRRAGSAPVRLTPFQGAVPFSTSKEGEFEGEVVFAGYGLSTPQHGYDDWAGVDAAGKVAIVLRHAPREDKKDSPWFRREAGRRGPDPALSFESKAKAAAKAGAIAVLFVNDRHHKDEALPTSSGEAELPIPAFAIPRSAANRLLAPLERELVDLEKAIDGDLAPRSQRVPGMRAALKVALHPAAARNVVFRRKGTDPALADEVVVVSAHMDHVGLGWFGSISGSGQVHNGADDNASGSAALLEVAEHLAAGPPMRRSVVFAGFCAEEKGLIGSEHWCARAGEEIRRVVANVNLDMVGRYRTSGEQDKGLVVVGGPTGVGFDEKIAASAKSAGVRVTQSWEAWEQSDHFRFYTRGVPVLFLHTGLHPDYHRPGDDWWKLDCAGVARVSRFAADVVRRIADDDARPEFRKKPLTPILGVAFRETDTKMGAEIGRVFPGFGGAAAGLQAGDVLVEMEGRPIAGPADVTKIVQSHKPGDEIDVVYRRAGKTTRVKVKIAGV